MKCISFTSSGTNLYQASNNVSEKLNEWFGNNKVDLVRITEPVALYDDAHSCFMTVMVFYKELPMVKG